MIVDFSFHRFTVESGREGADFSTGGLKGHFFFGKSRSFFIPLITFGDEPFYQFVAEPFSHKIETQSPRPDAGTTNSGQRPAPAVPFVVKVATSDKIGEQRFDLLSVEFSELQLPSKLFDRMVASGQDGVGGIGDGSGARFLFLIAIA